MKFFCILIAAIIMSGVASAEYYKYVDENGVLHFTDNLLEIPEAQREKIQKFKEIKAPPPASVPADSGTGMVEAGNPVKNKTAAPSVKEALPADDTATLSKLQDLNREKAVLDQEYELLVRKKQALREERQKVSGKEAAADYGKKISALNDEIRSFEERRQVYLEKVKAFNASQ